MEEGEAYAIETFASTGMGMIQENGEASHFAVIPNHFGNIANAELSQVAESPE